MTITIYHNPSCGTSRNVLAMIRQSGEEPVVIEYLKDPPTRDRLKELIAAMGISVRALLREKGTPYAELGLADPKKRQALPSVREGARPAPESHRPVYEGCRRQGRGHLQSCCSASGPLAADIFGRCAFGARSGRSKPAQRTGAALDGVAKTIDKQ
jgi:arsenate reductase (glutaredoxin)